MTTLTDEQARRLKRLAGRAESLLADEDFKLMLADLKNGAIREWAEAETTEKRDACWHSLHAISGLERLMQRYGQVWRAEEAKRGG